LGGLYVAVVKVLFGDLNSVAQCTMRRSCMALHENEALVNIYVKFYKGNLIPNLSICWKE